MADISDGDSERRRAYRRRLPFGRGAVLEIGGRAHIVGLVDLSVTGAYVTTRTAVPIGITHHLRILILPQRVELRLACETVRVSQAADESPDHPRGVALCFLEMDEPSRRLLHTFVSRERGPRP